MQRKGSLVVAACMGLCLLATKARPPHRRGAPARFPSHVVHPGRLPAIWVFARADCSHCRRHLHALQSALEQLPDSSRARACARVHVAGDLQAQACGAVHPFALQRTLGIRSTPLTWWVGADTSIQRTWWGARDPKAWTGALGFVLEPEAAP